MANEQLQEIVVEVVLNDTYDGAIRLLNDAQRLGFQLQGLTLAADGDGLASGQLALRVPSSVDAQVVAGRLARHRAVQRVEARFAM